MMAVVLCLTLASAVFAVEDTFVPSITQKPVPGLSDALDESGTGAVGKLQKEGDDVGLVYDEEHGIVVESEVVHINGEHGTACLVITPVSNAENDPDIPDDSRELLLWIYDQLQEQGTDFIQNCPGLNEAIAAALGEGKDVSDMVVRDLFDVTVLCKELEDYLEPSGTTICLDFDLGLEPGTFVAVIAYKNGEWHMIEDVEVLEDGTVTCTTYENFCPVAFLVPAAAAQEAPATGAAAGSNLWLWIVIAAVVLLIIVLLLIFMRKRKEKK